MAFLSGHAWGHRSCDFFNHPRNLLIDELWPRHSRSFTNPLLPTFLVIPNRVEVCPPILLGDCFSN